MFKLEIETGNAAFADDPAAETARILRAVAKTLSGPFAEDCGTCTDANGNTVGRWTLTGQ